METIFTRGQVAKICKVAPRTVSKWFDSGRLRGYQLPDSQDIRIPREHLINFLKEHFSETRGELIGELEKGVNKILLVGMDVETRKILNEMFPGEDFTTKTAASGFEAGIMAESIQPDCVVVDFAMGREEALMIIQNLRRNSEFPETVFIGLLSEEDKAFEFDRSVFTDIFLKPFDTALLVERIRMLVNRRKQEAVADAT
ncbi:MAG TPA: response regulator [Candidatus Andersenbacteria bacterium]|nr:response regulator [Candidatus Andersenbacteria bacterium]